MDRRADVMKETRVGERGGARTSTRRRCSLQHDDPPTGAGQRHRGNQTVRTGAYYHRVGLGHPHRQPSYASITIRSGTTEATLSPSAERDPITLLRLTRNECLRQLGRSPRVNAAQFAAVSSSRRRQSHGSWRPLDTQDASSWAPESGHSDGCHVRAIRSSPLAWDGPPSLSATNGRTFTGRRSWSPSSRVSRSPRSPPSERRSAARSEERRVGKEAR